MVFSEHRLNPPDYQSWPRFFVTLCDWGDSIISTMNAVDPAGAVFCCRGDKYDEDPWEKVMRIEAPWLHDWLEDWLTTCHCLSGPIFDIDGPKYGIIRSVD